MFGLPLAVRWETVDAPGVWHTAQFDVSLDDKHAAARHQAFIVGAAAAFAIDAAAAGEPVSASAGYGNVAAASG